MKNTIASLLQTRMDKCTAEQFWAVATLTAADSFFISQSRGALASIPRCFLLFAVAAATIYGIWFVIGRHRAYYKNRLSLASLLSDEKDAPDWLKRPPNLSTRNSLSGVLFYVGCLVVGCILCFFTYLDFPQSSIRSAASASMLEIKFGPKEIRQPIFERSEVTIKIQDPTNIELNVRPAP